MHFVCKTSSCSLIECSKRCVLRDVCTVDISGRLSSSITGWNSAIRSTKMWLNDYGKVIARHSFVIQSPFNTFQFTFSCLIGTGSFCILSCISCNDSHVKAQPRPKILFSGVWYDKSQVFSRKWRKNTFEYTFFILPVDTCKVQQQ